MKILIIDNEAGLRKTLRLMIESHCPTETIVDEADGVESGLTKIQDLQPDIVFLDIEMNDGTGFDLLRRTNHTQFQLIFTTAFNQYAIQAFRFSAIDYLLKPVDPDELVQALDKAMAQLRHHKLDLQLEILMEQLGNNPGQEKKIVLKDIDATYFIKVKDILYCEAEGAYTRFYITDSDPVLVSKNLKEYASILEPMGFIRTHHAYLANPEKIKLYDKRDGGALILDGGHSIPMSQRKKDQVMQLLEKR